MIVPDIQIKYYLLIPYIVGKEFVNWPLDLPEKKTPTKSDINMMLRSKFIKKKIISVLVTNVYLKGHTLSSDGGFFERRSIVSSNDSNFAGVPIPGLRVAFGITSIRS